MAKLNEGANLTLKGITVNNGISMRFSKEKIGILEKEYNIFFKNEGNKSSI